MGCCYCLLVCVVVGVSACHDVLSCFVELVLLCVWVCHYVLGLVKVLVGVVVAV